MGLRTHTAVWISVTLLVFFYMGHFIIGPDPARIVIASLVIGVNLAVCLTWFKRAWEAIRHGIRDGSHNIYIGVWLSSFISLAYFLYIVGILAAGRPEWSKALPIGGTFYVGFFLASAALLLTPLNTTEELEPVSLRWWFVAVALGGVAAGIMMTLAFLGIVTLDV